MKFITFPCRADFATGVVTLRLDAIDAARPAHGGDDPPWTIVHVGNHQHTVDLPSNVVAKMICEAAEK